jgi:hypothetical protein
MFNEYRINIINNFNNKDICDTWKFMMNSLYYCNYDPIILNCVYSKVKKKCVKMELMNL